MTRNDRLTRDRVLAIAESADSGISLAVWCERRNSVAFTTFDGVTHFCDDCGSTMHREL